MTTEQLVNTFEDRLGEIEDYLKVIEAIDEAVKSGIPRIGAITVSSQQQKILYSSVYIQAYNLVESTMTGCMSAIWKAIHSSGPVAGLLTAEALKEVVRHRCKTHQPLNEEKRLATTLAFVQNIVSKGVLGDEEPRRRSLGSWDDHAIEQFSSSWGIRLSIDPDTVTKVKRRFADDKGLLQLIKDRRNRLAHGDMSFAECGSEVSPEDLRRLVEGASEYLRAVLKNYIEFIRESKFISADSPLPLEEPEDEAE